MPRKLVVLAHAAGFCKEMWNPVIDDLIAKLPGKPFKLVASERAAYYSSRFLFFVFYFFFFF